MLHKEVSLGSKGEGCNGWQWAEKSFIVAVVADGVRTTGIVIDEAEIERTACYCLGRNSEQVETFWDRSRWVFRIVPVFLNLLSGRCVHYIAIVVESAGLV